jgi:FMN-dependent NADH-azoreductase
MPQTDQPHALRRRTLLHIDSSASAAHSVSRALTADVVANWVRAEPSLVVRYRDLAAQPIAHLTADMLQGDGDAPADLQRERRQSEAVVAEFLAADVVVIGAPMYNFAISSQLKAWIDRIVRAGRTFRYEPSGPVGLAGGKRVVIVSSRGGAYASAERGRLDFQESYLKLILDFMGVTDVRIIRAEGLAKGPEHRDSATRAARAAIAELFELAA